jgi:hypothetical protein
MGYFDCPKCKGSRHIDDGPNPLLDRCWECGTLVPWSAANLATFREIAVEDGDDEMIALLDEHERKPPDSAVAS